MLPGVELARRRRASYHGDVAVGAGAGEHRGHNKHQQLGAAAQAPTSVVGPALAARIRLEEKLRGAAPPSSSHAPSRCGRRMRERDGGATSRQQNIQQEHHQVLAASTELKPPYPAMTTTASRRTEMRRTPSKADICAVCLDEVRERHQWVTRLPCSHKYHSDCVLPWLAIQPDCPCCRTLVPSVDSLS